MALKSWYLSVIDASTHKPISYAYSRKVFFNAPELNKYIKENELVEKFPKPQYYILKEYY